MQERKYKKIYLAGGCFWGVQGYFDLLNGVVKTSVGYANSIIQNPSYEEVCTGKTNAVEAIEIIYDDAILPLALVQKSNLKSSEKSTSIAPESITIKSSAIDSMATLSSNLDIENKKSIALNCKKLDSKNLDIVSKNSTNNILDSKNFIHLNDLPDCILSRFLSIIDPFAINRQGNDIGTQYRSGIYCTDSHSLDIALHFIGVINRIYGKNVAIEVMNLQNFYMAENYHQKYLQKNPFGYCHVDIYMAKKSLKF